MASNDAQDCGINLPLAVALSFSTGGVTYISKLVKLARRCKEMPLRAGEWLSMRALGSGVRITGQLGRYKDIGGIISCRQRPSITGFVPDIRY